MTNLINKILVFDLDDTLIDTQKIKQILFEYAGSLGCSEKQIKLIHGEIRNKGFTLEGYADALSEITQRPSVEILSEMRSEIVRHKDELAHQDAIDFLELCKKLGVKIRLLTFGAATWQAEKIDLSGLKKYFSEPVTTENETGGKIEELGEIIGKGNGEEVVLFNDKLKEIVAALERYPEMTAYLRPIRQLDGELLETMDPSLRERIEILPNFRLLMTEVYDEVKK